MKHRCPKCGSTDVSSYQSYPLIRVIDCRSCGKRSVKNQRSCTLNE